MSEQPTLFYAGINAAARAETRLLKVGSGRELMYILLDSIDLKPIGNWRRPAPYQTPEEWEKELKISELADEIYANNGPADPLEGDVERGTGKFFITEGQRRWMALKLLVARGCDLYPNGEPINKVEVLCNPTGFTTADRLKKNYSSQNKMKLKPSELAAGFLLYKNSVFNEHGKVKSHQEIADDFVVSRQHVDNMIKINDLDPDVLKQLDYAEITWKDALSTLKKKKEVKYTGENEMVEKDGIIIKKGDIEVDADKMEQFFEDLNGNATTVIHPDDEAAIIIERDAALKAEEQSRKTASKLPEQKNTEKQEEAEAMAGLEYNPDNIPGYEFFKMSRNNLDKMAVIIDKLPPELNQYKADMCDFIRYNLMNLDNLEKVIKELI